MPICEKHTMKFQGNRKVTKVTYTGVGTAIKKIKLSVRALYACECGKTALRAPNHNAPWPQL